MKNLYFIVFLPPRSAAAFPTFQIEMLEIAFLMPQVVWAVDFVSLTVYCETFFWRPLFSLFFWISSLSFSENPHFLEIRSNQTLSYFGFLCSVFFLCSVTTERFQNFEFLNP